MNYRNAPKVTISSGDATSGYVDLTGWRDISIDLAAFTDFSGSTTNLTVTGCDTTGGTYRPIVTDSTTDIIAGAITPLGVEALPRFLKIASDRTAIEDYTIKLHAVD